MRGLFPISHPAIACSGIECYPYRLIFKGVIVAVHLLIVDALNLIRRIHAVQGSPCVETCQHALDQLIMQTPKTLKTRCANAARRACVFPVNAAKLAVIVVPIFSPNTKATPKW